jgi:hypothetical protein
LDGVSSVEGAVEFDAQAVAVGAGEELKGVDEACLLNAINADAEVSESVGWIEGRGIEIKEAEIDLLGSGSVVEVETNWRSALVRR